MPYGGINLGQHWLKQCFVAWWHEAIAWTNIDLSSVRSIGIHPRAISWGINLSSVHKINLKITVLKFHGNLPGANELSDDICRCRFGNYFKLMLLPWCILYLIFSHFYDQMILMAYEICMLLQSTLCCLIFCHLRKMFMFICLVHMCVIWAMSINKEVIGPMACTIITPFYMSTLA